eukprot:219954-Rhodomonas_salina.2
MMTLTVCTCCAIAGTDRAPVLPALTMSLYDTATATTVRVSDARASTDAWIHYYQNTTLYTRLAPALIALQDWEVRIPILLCPSSVLPGTNPA